MGGTLCCAFAHAHSLAALMAAWDGHAGGCCADMVGLGATAHLANSPYCSAPCRNITALQHSTPVSEGLDLYLSAVLIVMFVVPPLPPPPRVSPPLFTRLLMPCATWMLRSPQPLPPSSPSSCRVSTTWTRTSTGSSSTWDTGRSSTSTSTGIAGGAEGGKGGRGREGMEGEGALVAQRGEGPAAISFTSHHLCVYIQQCRQCCGLARRRIMLLAALTVCDMSLLLCPCCPPVCV